MQFPRFNYIQTETVILYKFEKLELVGLTFDGCSANLAMDKLLGSQIESSFFDSIFFLVKIVKVET